MGIFLARMPYQPIKEHLDHQIPDAFKSINCLMRQLKQDIGMDDRYIALMLDALSRSIPPSSRAEMASASGKYQAVATYRWKGVYFHP